MKSKTLNKSLKAILLLSPLLISASAVGSTVNQVGSSQKVSSIGPIKKNDVQLITSVTWRKPSTWHNPNPWVATVNDRFYRMYFSPATAKYMYNHFWNWGWYHYVTTVTASPRWSESKLFDEMLHGSHGSKRDDTSQFWQMTHNWDNVHNWFVGTASTYYGKPNIRFDKYNESDWHSILGNAVMFNEGAWLFIYCKYNYHLGSNHYGVGYGYA